MSIPDTQAGEAAALLRAFAAELRDPTQPLALLVHFAVAPRDAESVETAFARARGPTLNEAGCRIYELCRDPRDPGRFVVYEQWRSLADLEAHFRTAHFAAAFAAMSAVIVGAPEFKVLLPAA
jgi:quinol monooxygenase YgiN